MTKSKAKSGPKKLKESNKSSPKATPSQQSKTKSTDAATKDETKTNLKKSGSKTQVTNPASPDKAVSSRKNDKSVVLTPKLDPKDDSEQTSLPGTPSSSVRRSGRAPVLSSKFKDMEVDLFTVRKRPSNTLVGGETPTGSDSDHEPPKKRGRKLSHLVSGGSKNLPECEETPFLEEAPKEIMNKDLSKKKVNKKTSLETVTKEATKKIVDEISSKEQVNGLAHKEIATEVSPPKIISEVSSKELVSDVTSKEVENDPKEVIFEEPSLEIVQKVTLEVEKQTVREEPIEIVDDEIIESDVKNVTCKESEAAKDVFDANNDLENTESLEVTVNNEVTVTAEKEGNSKELMNIEIIGNAEETVHTEEDVNTAGAAVWPTSIEIDGKQVTLTEKDGETVAVVSMPLSATKVESNLHPFKSEPLASNPNVSIISLEHFGHIRVKQPPTLNMIEQDGSYLNIAIEPTSISKIMKDSQGSKSTKWHGRVLKGEQPYASNMVVKSALVQPPSSTNIVTLSKDSPLASPPEMFSLLTKSTVAQESELSPQKNPMHGLLQVKKPQKKIVIVRQVSHNHNEVNASIAAPANSKPLGAPTVVRVPQDLPSKKGSTTIVHLQKGHATSTVIPNTDIKTVMRALTSGTSITSPRTASEMLLKKLQEQQNKIVVNEDATTPGIVVKEMSIVQVKIPQEGTKENVETTESGEVDHVNNEVTEVDHVNNDIQVAEEVDHVNNDIQVAEEVDLVNSDIQVAEEVDHVNSDIQVTEELDHVHRKIHITVEPVASEVKIEADGKDIKKGTNVSLILDSSTGELVEELGTQETPSSLDATESATELTEMKNVELSSSPSPDKSTKAADLLVDKIKVIDNGIEYDMRVIEEEVAEEIIDNTDDTVQKEAKGDSADNVEISSDILLKQEPDDEDSNSANKHTSGTQTVYSPQVTADPSSTVTTSGETVHTLTSVEEDEDGQKKQIYYVSVVPNYAVMKKSAKQATCTNDTNWVLSDNGLYCCGKCNYKTDRKANFYKHRRLHTGSKPHVCYICQYKAGTSSNLKRHMGIHKDIREHKCDICGLSFRQKIHLERHVKYKHEEKRVQCPMCDYVCANEQPDLKMHMKRKHSSGSSWETVTCPQCSAEVSSRKDLKQHMKFHKDGPELKLFCKECSFVTDCQSRLKRHVAIHSKLKPFQCGVCNYRAAQKEHVLRHLRTQHKIEVKKECKRPWRRHKNIETEDGSKEKADFSSGDKIFACNHCIMRFAKLINLYKHLHTQHADIMPAETDGNYFCVVCEFSTSSKKNLLVHMRRHNLIDQTPPSHVYSCVLCRYINPKRRNLFQHMKKKHNINIIGQLDGDDEGSQDNENGEVIKSVLTSMTEGQDTAESSDSQSKNAGSIAHVIKLENIEHVSGEADDVHNLVIDTREDVSDVIHTSHTVEALEGLQALAEQAGLIDNIIEEQSSANEEQHIVLEAQMTNTEVVTTEDGQHFQQIFDAGESDNSAVGQAAGGLELTDEQLSSLRSGDMVEMDGELYVVELTPDATNPNKQVLSFLPVSTSS
ncbi:Transcriptional repressor CTCF [Biomphalaria glabrata]|nr:Transcriptional repressor CTCF [Biomphalaria glabrata]